MKIRSVMSTAPVRLEPDTTVAAAARMLARYNLGVLPVCGKDGKLRGIVTDRDLVLRCVASGRDPNTTRVSQVMTGSVFTVEPDTDAALAAGIMGRKQVRRLPVVENGRLCGMVSLGDLARQEELSYDAGDALAEISGNVAPE